MTLIIATSLWAAFLVRAQIGFGLSFLLGPWQSTLMAGANLKEGSFNNLRVKM